MASASWTTGKGAAKRVYDKLQNAQPEAVILAPRAPFDGSIKRIGESFQVATLVQPPNSVTYIGPTPVKTTLLTGRPMVILQAQALSYEVDIHEETPWALFDRMAESGEAAVDSYFTEMMIAMKKVGACRHEASLLLGQNPTGYGVVSSIVDNTTYMTIIMTPDSWRGGLWWALGPGATLDSWTTFPGSPVKNNATAALVLLAVNEEAHSIDVTFGGTASSEVAAGDVLLPEGNYSSGWLDMPGLLVQNSAITGSTMGIDQAANVNFRGNQLAVGGLFGVDVLEQGVGRLRNRMINGKITFYCPEPTWKDLSSEVASMRYVDSSYSNKKIKIGQEDLEYSTKRFGQIEIVLHPFLADSEAMAQVDSSCIRVGSRDVTFGVPSRVATEDLDRLLHINNTNAAEAFVTYDLGVMNRMPGGAIVFSGISH